MSPVPVRGLLDPAYLTAAGAAASTATARSPRRAPGNPPWQRRRAPRLPAAAAGERHQPPVDHRCGGQCRGDDHHHRGHLRRPAHGARHAAEQRADRFLLPAGGRRPAGGEPRGAGQAAALLDVAHHRLRRGWAAGGGGRLGRRVPHHRPCGADAGGDAGLGDGPAGGGRPAAHRRGERADRAGGRHRCRRPGPGAAGARLPGGGAHHDQRAACHPGAARAGGVRLLGGADPRRDGVALGE